MTACGFSARCGRPSGHRGHHGGWRTHVQAVAANPVIRDDGPDTRLGDELGPQTLRAAAEILAHGSAKEAAECMGVSLFTVKRHVHMALSRTGAVSYGHLGVVLGWTTFPEGLGH